MARLVSLSIKQERGALPYSTPLTALLSSDKVVGQLSEIVSGTDTFPITAVSITEGTFTVATDLSALFVSPRSFVVTDSTSGLLDGTYATKSSLYGSATVIKVLQAINTASATGNVNVYVNDAISAIALTATSGTGTVTLATGSAGAVTSVTVNGVAVTSGSVPYNTSLSQTATDVAANITAYAATGGYTAAAVGAVITLTRVATGGAANNHVVSATLTTITATYTNITGGKAAKTVSATSNIAAQSGASTGGAITAVSVLDGYFTVAGNHAAYINRIGKVIINGSTGNDGLYAASAAYDGTKTLVYANITNGVVDGTAYWVNLLTITGGAGTNSSTYRIVSVAYDTISGKTDFALGSATLLNSATIQGNINFWRVIAFSATSTVSDDVFTVSGDKTDSIIVGEAFTVSGSTGNNGSYTVKTVTYSAPNTLIRVNESFNSAVDDGDILIGETDTQFTYKPYATAQPFPIVVDETLADVAVAMNAANTTNGIVNISVTVTDWNSNQYLTYPYTEQLSLGGLFKVFADLNGVTNILYLPANTSSPITIQVSESVSAVQALANA